MCTRLSIKCVTVALSLAIVHPTLEMPGQGGKQREHMSWLVYKLDLIAQIAAMTLRLGRFSKIDRLVLTVLCQTSRTHSMYVLPRPHEAAARPVIVHSFT